MNIIDKIKDKIIWAKIAKYEKEIKRHSCGIYCDKPKCRRERVGHIHGGTHGVTYFCEKHKKWAEKQRNNK